ncbi:hypothetical protein SAMN05421770_10459 [Granulicella rosea]|uniref:Uncharacterized protein n=1 Tax=Granulicella rosea TaxID=474952 RepID=A0A239JQM2_9BACT|nr:hypothetical protein SAMN05421770_10459 [Granulicella rosea]
MLLINFKFFANERRNPVNFIFVIGNNSKTQLIGDLIETLVVLSLCFIFHLLGFFYSIANRVNSNVSMIQNLFNERVHFLAERLQHGFFY